MGADLHEDHRWLESVEGDEALQWVRANNARSLAVLENHPNYDTFQAAATEVLTTQDRIAYATIRDGFAYNFWQDDQHIKGIWRRSPADAYLADEPTWQTLLDIDALADAEGENWVFARATPVRGETGPTGRYLISLSLGGRDATTEREYDIDDGRFVEGGFVSPEAKQAADWVDGDSVLIATDWGPGTLTESGYPRSVRLWKRGQDLAEAGELLSGEPSDVGVWPLLLRRADGSLITGAVQRFTFFTGAYWLFSPSSSIPLRVPVPPKADINGLFKDQLIVSLQQDWQPEGQEGFRSGDLVSFDIGRFLDTGSLPPVVLMFRPGDRQSVQTVGVARDRVLLGYADNVISHLSWLDHGADGSWHAQPVALPGSGQAIVTFADERESIVLMSYQDFLTPDSLYRLDSVAADIGPELVKAGTAHFDPSGLTISQRSARSPDGTEVPYFLVHRQDLAADGETPTLLYGYGGFEVSMTPSYSATIGRVWLEQGGAYALANIRGGGEFGPSWHQAGLKQQRQSVYDDFIAVGEDLINTRVTTSDHLGIMGGSNGGLLMGVMLTQRPELWNAVVLQVPLLDMLRYHLLLAGASWVDEYGSPDVADERVFLEKISPYHRFDPMMDYPTPLFVTSTKDDRVHPGHARKMAKRFEDAGKPFLYYENIDGGHGAATTQIERARRVALEFVYLNTKLMP